MGSMEIWKNNLANRAAGTRKLYLHHFEGFLNYARISADSLREMKFLENQNSKPWERNKVENIVRGYIKSLQERELTCSTQNLAIASILSFFESQGMPLFLKRADNPGGCAFGSKSLTKEEIKRIRNAAEILRDKALVMFLKDSGLRQSDAAKLKWVDFKDYGEGFWGFQIQTRKKKIKARGFVGPEATEILELYKRKRLEGTQKIPAEKDIGDHPVFALISEPSKPVKSAVMCANLGKIISLAGIDNASPHGLRKFWEQNIHVENLAYQKQLNGRSLNEVERAYFWKETPELAEIYKGNYRNLRIEEYELKDVEDRLRRDYEREIRGLKNRIFELENEREDPLLKDIMMLSQLPGGKDLFKDIVKDAKKRLRQILKEKAEQK